MSDTENHDPSVLDELPGGGGGDGSELCPGNCGCRLGTDDADRFECGCDGGCCGDSDTQPDPYIDAMAAEHVREYEPACCELPRNHHDWPDDPGCQRSTVC